MERTMNMVSAVRLIPVLALLFLSCGTPLRLTEKKKTPSDFTVSIFAPAGGGTELRRNENILIIFSHEIDPESLGPDTIRVTRADGSVVTGTLTYDAATRTVTFTPDDLYPASETLTVTVDASVRRLSDNATMDVTQTATFNTSIYLIGTLQITALNPTAGTTNLHYFAALSFTFSDPIDSASLTSRTVRVLDEAGSDVAGTISYDAATLTVTFKPLKSWPDGMQLLLMIDANIVKQDDGTVMQRGETAQFTTASYVKGDLTMTITPGPNDTTIPNRGPVTVTFSGPVDPNSLTDETIRVKKSDGTYVSGDLTYDPDTYTVTFKPDTDYTLGEELTVEVDRHIVKESDGTIMESDSEHNFTKGNTLYPSIGDIEIDLEEPIRISYPYPIDPTSIPNDLIKVYDKNNNPIPGTVTYDNTDNTVVFVPTTPYPSDDKIKVVVEGTVKKADDQSDVPSVGTSSFTTLNATNLLAQWKFDNDGTDASGNGHTLTNVGVTFNASKRVQGTHAAYFDGLKHYFETAGAFNLGSKFTVTVWVNLDDPPGASVIKSNLNTIISNGDGGVPKAGFKLFINEYQTSNRRVATEGGNGTTGALMLTSENFITTGSWKHFAFVVDKTAPQGSRTKIYFNGERATQTAHPNNLPDLPSDFDSNRQMRIGEFFNYLATDNFSYQGFMDDLRIYSVLLTDEQIAQIATQH
jgi:uncharacterized protein YijF (DUF1287 family)